MRAWVLQKYIKPADIVTYLAMYPTPWRYVSTPEQADGQCSELGLSTLLHEKLDCFCDAVREFGIALFAVEGL
jgi:hypothetical protein